MIGEYLRDPDEIFARSVELIRAEADLSRIPDDLAEVAVRMIHACGMVDIAPDIRWGGEVAAATEFALLEGADLLCDCEAVRAAISRKFLPEGVDLVVTLNEPGVSGLARQMGNTRSAAAVELWRPRLKGAVAVIGNAPTALFHLLELLEGGSDRPAAIIATPVGFVGAEESKAILALGQHGVPFLTLLGRRGGSAIAAAALNAIAAGIRS